ncbi:MAG: hypothetical protein IKP31_03485 [Lachnospiraceae bacterium]|nr:hypothetical protein [Lachnospiraceae bacterium]
MRIKGYLRGLGAGLFISAVLMGIATSGKNTLSDEEIKRRASELGMVEEDSVLVKPKTDETASETGRTDKVKGDTNTESTVPDVEVRADNNSDKVKDEEKKQDEPLNKADSSGTETENTKETPEELRAKEDRAMGGQNESTVQPSEKDGTFDNETKPVENKTSEENNIDERTDKKSDDNSVEEKVQTDSFTLQIASGTTSYDVAKLLEKGGVVDSAADFDNYLCDNRYDDRINHGVFKIPADAGYEEIAKIITGAK